MRKLRFSLAAAAALTSGAFLFSPAEAAPISTSNAAPLRSPAAASSKTPTTSGRQRLLLD